MPIGKEIDEIGCNLLIKRGYRKNILHRTGHSIGFHSPHGKHGHLSLKNEEPILINMGYTIEPGVYLKGEFGVRSEINFFINEYRQLVLTIPVQRELVRI